MTNILNSRLLYPVAATIGALWISCAEGLADNVVEEAKVRAGIYDQQKTIVIKADAANWRRVEALRNLLAAASMVSDARNLADDAITVIKTMPNREPIRTEAAAALGELISSPTLMPTDGAFAQAADELKSIATGPNGFLAQAAAVRSLAKALGAWKHSDLSPTNDERLKKLVDSTADVAVAKPTDPNVQVAATATIIAKGNQILKVVSDAKTTAEEAATKAAVSSATEEDKKKAAAAKTVAKTVIADASFPMRTIWGALSKISISTDTFGAEFASRALQRFLNDQMLEGAPPITSTTAAAPVSAPSGQGPLAGGSASSSGGAHAPDLSHQPLAVTDIPGVTVLSTVTQLNGTMGISITRPYDPVRDAVNTGKRIPSTDLPSTTDAARKARAVGASRASGAAGITFSPAKVPKKKG